MSEPCFISERLVMDMLFGNKGAQPTNPPSKPGTASSADLIKDGSAETFVTDVIEMSMSVPVIVDFWATWCEPCKQLGPMLEKLVRELRGAVRMVKIDVDKNQDLAAQLRVQSVPTVYAFKGGRPFDAFAGALPESQLKTFFQKLTAGQEAPVSVADMIAAANQALIEGHADAAIDVFQQILQEENDNTAALGGLVRALLALGEVDNAKGVLAQIPPELAAHADIAAARSAVELVDQAAKVGPLAELRRVVSEDPANHQARFDLALAYYAGGEVEVAIDELLEIFGRQRNWNEDAARKQLLQIFEALGPAHPLTQSGRRRLSSLMFS